MRDVVCVRVMVICMVRAIKLSIVQISWLKARRAKVNAIDKDLAIAL